MVIIGECHQFLAKHAKGRWAETFRFRDPESGEYVRPPRRDLVLLRVEMGDRRAFYWLHNLQDATAFNEHVGLQLKGECHEIILTPRTKFFFDIDLVLTYDQKMDLAEFFKYDLLEEADERSVMDAVGSGVSRVYGDAILVSLEEHGIDLSDDLQGFDHMFTMRNRPLPDGGYKISIHLITNLLIPLGVSKAIASHVKTEAFKDADVLGIDAATAELLAAAIDETQYRHHGSLSLPFGTKGENTSKIYKDYAIPGQSYFIAVGDPLSLSTVDLRGYAVDSGEYDMTEASPAFVKEALRHIDNVQEYSPLVWSVAAATLRGSFMRLRRLAPSMCSICRRTHDADQSLLIIFNSERGTASWKCTRSLGMKPIIFYDASDDVDEEDVELFAARPMLRIVEEIREAPIISDEDELGEDHDLAVFATRPMLKIVDEIYDPLQGRQTPLVFAARALVLKARPSKNAIKRIS